MSKLARNEVEVEITGFYPFSNEKYEGFKITWSGNIGFGEYEVYRNRTDDSWYADSECMDSDDDKWFIMKLMDKFIDGLKITG